MQEDLSARAGATRILDIKPGMALEAGKNYRARVRRRDGKWQLPYQVQAPKNAPNVSFLWENINRFPRMNLAADGLELECVFTLTDIVTQCLVPPCPGGVSDATFVAEIHSIR